MQKRVTLIVCAVLSMLPTACATKSYVQDQVREQGEATQAQVARQFEREDTKLQESAERAAASRQAIDAADQRIQSLDARVGELGTTASAAQNRAEDAHSRADQATGVARDAEARLSQRIADRNKYRLVETRYIYFESGRADLRDSGVSELDDVAKVLQADPNALVELQGFADPRGNDRYNDELARERVEAVGRDLVRRHDIDLRQIRAIAMGKVALAAGEKPTDEVLAQARRVEIRILAPWSSWEDIHAGTDDANWPAASVIQPEPAKPEPTKPEPDAAAASPDAASVVRRALEDQRRMLLDDRQR